LRTEYVKLTVVENFSGVQLSEPPVDSLRHNKTVHVGAFMRGFCEVHCEFML